MHFLNESYTGATFFGTYPTGIHLLKDNNRKLEQGVKYVQSYC